MILFIYVLSLKNGGGIKSLEGLNLSLLERYVDLVVLFLSVVEIR